MRPFCFRTMFGSGIIAAEEGCSADSASRTLHSRWIILRSRRRCARAKCCTAATLPVEVRRTLLPKSLQLRLVWCRDQESPILRRIIHKHPVLIFVLVIELADRLVLAEAGNSYDRSTDDLA